MIAKQSLY